MWDETKDNENVTEHAEWSGTPFQAREDAGDEAAEQAAPAVESAAPAPSTEGTKQSQSVDYGRTFRSLTEGDVVKGVVVHIDKEGVLVDVGTKSEGLIRPHELSRDSSLDPEQIVQVGESIDVYVMQSEDHDGALILSKKRADFEQAWERVEECHRNGKVVTAMVSDRVKGGLVVDLGIRGFVPASHVGSGKIKNLDRYVGQSLALKVIEVDRERRKVVLSNRMAVEDEREKMRTTTIATLAEGQIRAGLVRRITDYGAFVDLGGIDGLLHISEMSWTRIKHPSEAVKVGDKIQVMVLKMDLNQGKVSLGLRQILPDPWAEIAAKYHVGDVIKGHVTRLVPFGAFVQVEGGIEGIIPNSELATRRVSKPEDVVSVGQEVEIKVIDVRPDERRMTLSLRALQPQPAREERREPQGFTSYAREEPRTTIGDLVGDMFEAKSQKRDKKRKIREAEEQHDDIDEIEIPLDEPMFADEEHPAVEEAEVEAEAAVVDEPEDEAPVVEEPEAEAPAVEAEEVAVETEPEPVEEPVVEEPAAEVEAVAVVEETIEAEPEAEAAEEPVAEAEPAVEAEAETESEESEKPKEE